MNLPKFIDALGGKKSCKLMLASNGDIILGNRGTKKILFREPGPWSLSDLKSLANEINARDIDVTVMVQN